MKILTWVVTLKGDRTEVVDVAEKLAPKKCGGGWYRDGDIDDTVVTIWATDVKEAREIANVLGVPWSDPQPDSLPEAMDEG